MKISLRLLSPLLISAVATSFADAQPPVNPFGVNVHAPGEPLASDLLDLTRQAGLGWIRVDLVWAFVESAPDELDWSVYDAILDAAESRGLSVLANIAYTPAWATDGPALSGVPRDVSDWRSFCRRAARRYAGRIPRWEVWNEPNLSHFWDGDRAEYMEQILIPCGEAIHAADPEALVGGPALAHLTSGDRDWYRWLAQAITGSAGVLDFVTHHAYDRDGPADVTAKLDADTLFGSDPALWDLAPPSVREVLEVTDWNGEVWLTETGWASDEVGESLQADHLEGFLSTWLGDGATRSWLDAIMIYELWDDPNPAVAQFGLLRSDLSPKPAYGRVQALTSDTQPLATLLDGQFDVSVRWRDPFNGGEGVAGVLPYSDETALFWFFDPDNVELAVKLLDGGGVNQHVWVFFGALSTVEYWVTVTERATGELREYHNPPTTLCGQADIEAFPTSTRQPPPRARPRTRGAGSCGDGALCLRDGRFAVEVAWTDTFNGGSGVGVPIPGTDESGSFWFFDEGNLELTVKVLDGIGVNGHYWVFFGALSNVEYRVTVTDLDTGARRIYDNPAGTLCGQADIEAFPG